MIYNVFGGTLNFAQLTMESIKWADDRLPLIGVITDQSHITHFLNFWHCADCTCTSTQETFSCKISQLL